jgi:DNA-directed RNA polymerase subunit L
MNVEFLMLMELKFLEDKKNRIVVEVKGETHTFISALTDELWNDDSVKVAAYRIDHPLIGVPRIIVETTGESATEALSKAVQRLKKKIETLGSAAVKAIK